MSDKPTATLVLRDFNVDAPIHYWLYVSGEPVHEFTGDEITFKDGRPTIHLRPEVTASLPSGVTVEIRPQSVSASTPPEPPPGFVLPTVNIRQRPANLPVRFPSILLDIDVDGKPHVSDYPMLGVYELRHEDGNRILDQFPVAWPSPCQVIVWPIGATKAQAER